MAALYGLIGYPLGHSFSERYFSEKFLKEGITDAAYRNFPIENIGLLPELLAVHPALRGFNVTIPYKEQVIPYLTALDPEAEKIGAVNCVKIDGEKLTGYNTDVYGFRASLLGLIGEERPAGALVFGTGGASRAVKYVLKELGIPYTEVSRTAATGRVTYDDLDSGTIAANRLIINTTPLGTYPDTDEAPALPYGSLTAGHYLLDLVYNPAETLFLRNGLEHGAKIMNGYGMLAGQAERSWQIWQERV